MPRIAQRDDRVEHELVAQFVVEEEGLRHRARVGQAGGLDQHVVEAVATAQQLAEDAQQVAAHGAADAAVVRLEELLLGADHQRLVDTDFTELVLDDGDAVAVALGEDAGEQRRLAGAEVAGEYRDRNAGSRHVQVVSVSRAKRARRRR